MDVVRRSIARQDPSLYSRFDLVYGADGTVKMLEINGDAHRLGDRRRAVALARGPDARARPVEQRARAARRRVGAAGTLGATDGNELHFFYDLGEGDAYDDGEMEMTAHYLMDTAVQAGFATLAHPMAEVEIDPDAREFRDVNDYRVRNAFKLYAWEQMLAEPFGRRLVEQREANPVRWFEPAWKALLSAEALLPVLWERNPGHRLLLPAYFDEPGDLVDWVAKPLHGQGAEHPHPPRRRPGGRGDAR